MNREEQTSSASDLYPELNEEQLETAEANLRQYLTVLLRIAARLRAANESIVDVAVDCSFDSEGHQAVTSPLPEGPAPTFNSSNFK